MRILSCTGYYATGSSAVTDLFGEFDCTQSLGEYEFRFAQDPDGISDLEYNLVENHHRLNSGHALKKFKRLVDFLSGGKIIKRYEGTFKGNFKKLSYEYIDALTDYKFKGYWQEDLRDRGRFFYFRKALWNAFMSKTFRRPTKGRDGGINRMPREITFGSRPTEEKFLEATREYIDKLFSSVNPHDLPYLVADQLFPPSNLSRYIRYTRDAKIFIVDRDPRDLFILERERYRGYIAPREVETFCKWFETIRAHRKNEEVNTEYSILIQFEDMIKNYEETTDKIIAFAGLDKKDWNRCKQLFNPEQSIKNTQMWLKYPKYAEEIKYIENRLTEYLYNW